MALIFLDFKFGSRYQMGRIYSVREPVAQEACDQPGPPECTGGLPYARRLDEDLVTLPPTPLADIRDGFRPYDEDRDRLIARGTLPPEARPTPDDVFGEPEPEPEPEPIDVDATREGGLSVDALSGLTVPQLKEMLASRGLSVTGRKAELVERLLAEPEG